MHMFARETETCCNSLISHGKIYNANLDLFN